MFEQFGAVQKAIAARYGGDPSVHDLPRVVRLPGFIHRKGKPFLSRAGTKKLDVTSYDWNEIRSAFPPVDDEKPPRPDPQPPRAGNDLPKRWKFLNTYALDHLDLWVPRLFPAANKSKQGYRVSSAALGRNLEEDISFTRDGIVDFGVHDMGDANQGRRTAIDIVQEWNRCDFEAWPSIPIRALAGADDRFFPVDFQRRVAHSRLGIDADILPGGHLIALARPDLVAEYLIG